MTDEANETHLDDPMYIEKSKREDRTVQDSRTQLYDVLHHVDGRSFTLLSEVKLETAKMCVRGSSLDLEIVPHVEAIGRMR